MNIVLTIVNGRIDDNHDTMAVQAPRMCIECVILRKRNLKYELSVLNCLLNVAKTGHRENMIKRRALAVNQFEFVFGEGVFEIPNWKML